MQADPVHFALIVVLVVLPQLLYTRLEIGQGKIVRRLLGGTEIQPVVVSAIDQLCLGQRYFNTATRFVY